jgi:CheY-like chemotaxis protein
MSIAFACPPLLDDVPAQHIAGLFNAIFGVETSTALFKLLPCSVKCFAQDVQVLRLEDARSEFFEALGHDVITALSGTEALKGLERDEHIEVLLTDINMPNMSGLELARRAKQLRQSLKAAFISGRDSPVADVPVLRKPFGETDLGHVLRAMNASS